MERSCSTELICPDANIEQIAVGVDENLRRSSEVRVESDAAHQLDPLIIYPTAFPHGYTREPVVDERQWAQEQWAWGMIPPLVWWFWRSNGENVDDYQRVALTKWRFAGGVFGLNSWAEYPRFSARLPPHRLRGASWRQWQEYTANLFSSNSVSETVWSPTLVLFSTIYAAFLAGNMSSNNRMFGKTITDHDAYVGHPWGMVVNDLLHIILFAMLGLGVSISILAGNNVRAPYVALAPMVISTIITLSDYADEYYDLVSDKTSFDNAFTTRTWANFNFTLTANPNPNRQDLVRRLPHLYRRCCPSTPTVFSPHQIPNPERNESP